LTTQSTNKTHVPIIKDTVEENLSNFTVLKGDDKHKNKKLNKNTHHWKISTFIVSIRT